MNRYAALASKIWQKDNYSFVLEWTDGTNSTFRLSQLQEKCPCAGCSESPKKSVVDENVQAIRIVNVGRYGLRIEYTSGCSMGIYSFDSLYSMNRNPS